MSVSKSEIRETYYPIFVLVYYVIIMMLYLVVSCKHGGISKACGNLKLFINFYHGITGYWVSHAISLFVLGHGHSLGRCPKKFGHI